MDIPSTREIELETLLRERDTQLTHLTDEVTHLRQYLSTQEAPNITDPISLPPALLSVLLPHIQHDPLVPSQNGSGANSSVVAAITQRAKLLQDENDELYDLLRHGEVGKLKEEVRGLTRVVSRLQSALKESHQVITSLSTELDKTHISMVGTTANHPSSSSAYPPAPRNSYRPGLQNGASNSNGRGPPPGPSSSAKPPPTGPRAPTAPRAHKRPRMSETPQTPASPVADVPPHMARGDRESSSAPARRDRADSRDREERKGRRGRSASRPRSRSPRGGDDEGAGMDLDAKPRDRGRDGERDKPRDKDKDKSERGDRDRDRERERDRSSRRSGQRRARGPGPVHPANSAAADAYANGDRTLAARMGLAERMGL